MSQLFGIDDARPFKNVGFFKIFFIKHVSFKGFYQYIKLLQSGTIFKEKNSHEVSCN